MCSNCSLHICHYVTKCAQKHNSVLVCFWLVSYHSIFSVIVFFRSVSLSSLYSLLKARLCPYFYLCSYQVGACVFNYFYCLTIHPHWHFHCGFHEHNRAFCLPLQFIYVITSVLSVHSAVQGNRSWGLKQHLGLNLSYNEGSQRGHEGWRWV